MRPTYKMCMQETRPATGRKCTWDKLQNGRWWWWDYNLWPEFFSTCCKVSDSFTDIITSQLIQSSKYNSQFVNEAIKYSVKACTYFLKLLATACIPLWPCMLVCVFAKRKANPMMAQDIVNVLAQPFIIPPTENEIKKFVLEHGCMLPSLVWFR